MENIVHKFDPVYNSKSKILILGTIPSPKSRELGFYYSHPKNRFWQIVSEIFTVKLETIESKKAFLLENKIALWDVLESCKIKGAADSSIIEPIYNNLEIIFSAAKIKYVFTTGQKATKLYRDYFVKELNFIDCVYLPSTSPANCNISYNQLLDSYKIIKKL